MRKLTISILIGIACLGTLPVLSSQHAKKIITDQSTSTNVIAFQNTTDGWLQHVGVYADGVICTNIAGPREGVQFIIFNNGALADMSHTYKQHEDHFSHTYSWGKVNTYKEHQNVVVK